MTAARARADIALGVAFLASTPMGALSVAYLGVRHDGLSLWRSAGAATSVQLFSWEALLVLFLLGFTALAEYGLRARSEPRLRSFLALALVDAALLLAHFSALLLRARTGTGLDRDHIRVLVAEIPRLWEVTAPLEMAGLVLLVPAALALGALVVAASLRVVRRRPSGWLRLHLLCLGGAALVAGVTRATILEGGEVYEARYATWTTLEERYWFYMEQQSLPLTRLLLGKGQLESPLDAGRPEVQRYVRVGGPVESVNEWLGRIDRRRFRPRNVLVVKIDSARWDELAETGGDPRTLPFLSSLAEQGVLFDRSYATGSETAYSFPSMLISQYPLKRKVRDYHEDLSYPHLVPPELLRPLGYRTGFFTTDDLRWQKMHRALRCDLFDACFQLPLWLRERTARGGYTRMLRADRELMTALLGPEGQAHYDLAVTRSFLAWVREEPGRPFFALLDLNSAHYPYHWPSSMETPFQPTDMPPDATFLHYRRESAPVMRNRFRTALRYCDGLVEMALGELSELGLRDDTLVVIFSDNGQSFWEHDVVTHGGPAFEQQIRVFVIIQGPGVPKARVRTPISLLDLLPTVLGLLGLPQPCTYQGFDLLDPRTPEARPVYFVMQSPMTNQEAVIYTRYKYIDDYGRGRSSLFDIEDDPGEQRDLAGSPRHLDVLHLVRGDLRAWHMSQLIYYSSHDLFSRFGPPRYREIWRDQRAAAR